ncbi:ankyrin repeat domain-containing protein [Chamaesiphon sp. OTE_8_metabat_110]|uniref:ankyrin repeat domain-containing protein n=1 Tax=Chamaesiphon sp. OTE_8_metabat_110 TaxID=2964696 RepID=UPI002869F5C4|nr:ankyrin repeat domain-containing protein [Chamaesiphon sp. OTE_8_metabat_110]
MTNFMEIANASGTIVDTRYQLVEHLGEGGSGSTYSAIRLEDGATVAIKILSLRHLNDWKQLELFEREAKVLAQLNHPQIPNYLEYFHVDTPTNRAFYIVQQLAPGKPLTAWVQSGWRGTEAEVRDIASQLLEILAYLHQQSPPLIHRDLKPHNIIRNDDGRVFLVDFGAVQDVYNNTLLKGSTVAGTFGYMAPEQFRGLAVPASDLYGLGATILYLLTHRSPADLPQARLKLNFRAHVNISDRFADWLETILEPDLSARFPSAAAALSALQKPNRFRIQRGAKIGFPWRGATIAATILAIFVPLIYEYRYAFTTRLGFPARDICDAIERNDVTSLQQYLDRGVSVNATVVNAGRSYIAVSPSRAGSLLHCAIEHKQVEIVKYLLENGANIYTLNSNSWAPIHEAINMPCGDDKDCARRTQIIMYLLDYKTDINLKGSDGSTLLMSAVKSQDVKLVKYLLERDADPQPLTTENQYSLWHTFANSGGKFKQTETTWIAQQLMLTKLDINQTDSQGNTPLHLAIERNNGVSLIDILLANGARTDLRNYQGETPLTIAISKNYFDAVKLLLSRNSKVNFPDGDGKTPLMSAIDAATNDGDGDRFTPATFTSPAAPPFDRSRSAPKIVKLLLAKGANPNLVDRDGNTALHLLSNLDEFSYGCRQQRSLALYILDLLVRDRVDIKAVNKHGDTALHVFAKKDFFPITDRLISYGGNPLQKNRQGINALELIKIAPSRSSRCEP